MSRVPMSRVSILQRAACPMFTLGGLGASFGLAACCALPLYLSALGVGSAWLGGIAVLADGNRTAFTIVALVGLIGGAALLLLQRKTMPAALLWLTALGLLIGAVFLYLGLTVQ